MSAEQCDRCGHGMDLHKQLHEYGQFVTYCVDDEYGAGDDWQCGCRFETPEVDEVAE